MVLRRQAVLRDQMTVEIDEGERRIHGRDVEHLAAIIGMRLDPAIGDRERPAVRHQDRLMRADAARGKFADAPKFIGCIVDADPTLARGKIVLGGEEQPAVFRPGAVAEEMPVRPRDENLRRAAAVNVERHSERAGTPREGDRAPACHMDGEIVPARRHTRSRG